MSDRIINLRSDTVTVPTKEMRECMASASVGDDAYGEDPSVNLLQDYCKELFGKQDSLFVTSGMMANRLAFLSQTSPGDEVITDHLYHVNFFDSAPLSALAGVVMNTRQTIDGILKPEHVEEAIRNKQRYDYFAQVKLISIENTMNGYSGKIFPYSDIEAMSHYAKSHGIRLHLDGARLMNAHIETKIPLADYAKLVDTLSLCFSKGLGAPYGSILVGDKETIALARKYRLWLGGGIHQGGMLAAGAYYALKNHISDLKRDHANARVFASQLKLIPSITIYHEPVQTNIVQFSISENIEISNAFHHFCEEAGLLLFPWMPNVFRVVFHRGISEEDVMRAISLIQRGAKQ